ncbi:hypothetical protein SAMN05421505_12738 [Sinosporangium album]|uniref:Protein kinase domain-containing protein n=1 Tax=Sinosporangium album TaxID=504805 RepID=A0A1G8GGY4_9ACTN|nr:hypothetical protein [Sinosporangium album]SDH93611.1 hypothetical protein SAMN05421505_12738 [Sinosporangium album]
MRHAPLKNTIPRRSHERNGIWPGHPPCSPATRPSLGDFWLAGRLGAGGQGVVYEAYDSDGARVALKVLHGDAADDPALRGRFGKEATAARRVASFCTAKILAVDLEGPKPYIVSSARWPGPLVRSGTGSADPAGWRSSL